MVECAPMTDTRCDIRIDKLARHQHGLVELGQAHDRGVSRKELRTRLARGSLRQVDAGVYATMGAPSTWEQALSAACLAAGPEALVSHRAAATLWELIRPPAPVEIVVPYPTCPTPTGAIVHRSTDLRNVDVARRHGLPVTNPIRTVGDLGSVAPGLVPHAMPNDSFASMMQALFRETPSLTSSLVWLAVILVVFLSAAARIVARREYVLEQ